MRNHIISAALFAVLVSIGACAQADDRDILESDDTAVEWPTGQTERVWVEGRSVAVAGTNDGIQSGDLDGACACTTVECFDQWVVNNLGCDVCASFVCDGDTVARSCMACEETPIAPAEQWDGDGRLE